MSVASFDRSAPLEALHGNERLKHASRHLRGTIAESLADEVTGAVSDDDALLTKFFGIYQQDDRDLREERRLAKLEPRYQFMVRVRLPGGVCTPEQWVALDRLAREHGNATLRLTTRQTFQLHGVRKRSLRPLLQGFAAAGLDTVAACGDDNRNVIATANPLLSRAHAQVSELARMLSDRLMPRTGAYREIWLEQPAAEPPPENEEPLYGRTYLPRKFKIALAVPPQNDVDVYAHDLGFVAVLDGERIEGFNVLVGGGMGMTHRQPATFPRLADVIGFCAVEDVPEIAEHTMCIQRDFGNRKDRAHARFKYTIEDRGIDWFRGELERRRGKPLEPARPVGFESSGDRYGWHRGADGRWHYTIFVPGGRVADRDGVRLLTALRTLAAMRLGAFALTTNQNVILAGVADADRENVERVLGEHGVRETTPATPIRGGALACVALPTCGLAMAESERYLPEFLAKLDALARKHGVENEPLAVRMSGCPNGCSRPYLGEIALVGKAPGKYNLYVGGSPRGERLATLLRENVAEAEILAALDSLLGRYAAERSPDERFGDFVVRAQIVPRMEHGRDFQRVAAAR